MKNIGFIGIGTMGRGMVKSLLKSGFNVFAYNRTRSKAEAIKHKNFNIVDKPKELPEKCGVIFTCVSSGDALKDVLFSENGVFKTLNGKGVLVDCGTTSAELTKEIYGKAKNKNAEFLDAPITGSKIGAESGQLVFMVGGSKGVFDKCKPLWDAMGKRAVYCGSNGAGQKAKYALNLAQALVLEGYLEGLIFGLKNNVPMDAMIEILDNSGAKNGVASFKMPCIISRDFNPHFKYKLMHKDLKIAEDEMKKLNISLPLSKTMFRHFKKGHKKGLDEEDFCSLVKLLEEEAGIRIGDK